MKQFFEMGGYAAFVWPAYAVTLAAIVLNIVWARRALARSREEARRRLAMRGGGPGRRAGAPWPWGREPRAGSVWPAPWRQAGFARTSPSSLIRPRWPPGRCRRASASGWAAW